MADAKKCDRCGKFFEGRFDTCIELTTYDNMHRNVEFDCGFLPDLDLGRVQISSQKMDLCPDCVESFLRIRRDGKIIIMPVRFDTVSTKWYANDPVLYFDDKPYIAMGYTMPTGELSFTVVGDTIVEDTKITGSEY